MNQPKVSHPESQFVPVTTVPSPRVQDQETRAPLGGRGGGGGAAGGGDGEGGGGGEGGGFGVGGGDRRRNARRRRRRELRAERNVRVENNNETVFVPPVALFHDRVVEPYRVTPLAPIATKAVAPRVENCKFVPPRVLR